MPQYYTPKIMPALQQALGTYQQFSQAQEQQKAQQAAQEQQVKRNQLLGQMLGGSELAMMDPMAFMQGQEFMAQQATQGPQAGISPEQQQLMQTLTEQSLGGNQEAFNKLAGLDPAAAQKIQGIIKSQAGIESGAQKAFQQKQQDFAEWRNQTMTTLSNSPEDQRPELYNYFREQASSLFPEVGKGLPQAYNQDIQKLVDAFGSAEEQLPTGRFTIKAEGPNKDIYEYDSAKGGRKLLARGQPPTPKLTAFGEKTLSKLQDQSVEAVTAATRYDDLAARFEASKPAAGWFGSVWGSFKDITGQQDLDSMLRTEYNASRMKEVMKNLPAGPASDVDVKNAMRGVPPENANAESIASFLRGMAKIEKMAAITADVKSQWYEQNTSSGLAKKDMEIGGQLFKKGSRLNDAIEGIVATQMPPQWTNEQQNIVDQLRAMGMSEQEIMEQAKGFK